MSWHKPFDGRLSKASESISKPAFSRWAGSYAESFTLYPENDFVMKFDASAVIHTQTKFFELECRYNWKDGCTAFPFGDVNIPERRARHLTDARDWAYAAVAGDGQGIGILWNPKEILPAILPAPNANCYRRQGDELFFKVPCDSFDWYYGI
jgi:hypothetical protein